MAWRGSEVEPPREGAQARDRLASFRRELYGCFTARADALFELADAVLCADGPVKTLVGLSLAPEHQRGHGALYDAVNCGRVEIARLRRAVAGLPLPGWGDGRIRLGVDVSPWLRPGAATSPDRLFCHVYGRGKGQAQMIPGWPFSVVAALEPGRTSWTAVLDAVRLGPDDDETEVTAAQVRDVVARLIEAGHWREGDPRSLGRPQRRRAAHHRRHPDPPEGRSPARRPRPQAGVAVVLPHRRSPRRRGPVVAGVLAPVRPRAHLPPVQAGPRLDRAEDPRPRRR